MLLSGGFTSCYFEGYLLAIMGPSCSYCEHTGETSGKNVKFGFSIQETSWKMVVFNTLM